jgi:hypothetical protein
VAITAAPIAGTNAIITNPYSLWVQAGQAQFDGVVSLNGTNLNMNGGIISDAAGSLNIGSINFSGAVLAGSGGNIGLANRVWINTAPTIASGFGTSPSVVVSNGTAAFQINVGTGGAASSGVVTLPSAATGYMCQVSPNATPQAAAVMYSVPTSQTSITITNYTASTGVALAWPASTVINVTCSAY